MKECFKAQICIVKDHDGNLVMNEESIINKFKTYLKNILDIHHENRDENKNITCYAAQPLIEEKMKIL